MYVGEQGKEKDACTEETEITRGRKGRVMAREGKKRRHVGKGKEHFRRGSGNVLIASHESPMPGTKEESFPSPSLLLFSFSFDILIIRRQSFSRSLFAISAAFTLLSSSGLAGKVQ